MEVFRIIFTFVIILTTSLPATTPLCTDSNTRPLDSFEKAELEKYLANSKKYASFYNTIKEEPCFEEQLQKLFYLIDFYPNEVLIEHRNLAAPIP